MPELGIPRTEFTDAIKDYETNFYERDYDQEHLQKIMDTFDAKFVGDGGEVFVYDYNLQKQSSKKEKIIAFRYEGMEAEEMKRIFYTQRLLSNLFPDKFPTFSAAFSGPNDESEAGTIRTKVQNAHTLDRLVTAGEMTPEDMVQRVHNFNNEIRDMLSKINIKPSFDLNLANYMLNQEGTLYYVDALDIKFDDNFNLDIVRPLMEQQGYSIKQINTALKAIQRLNQT